MHQLSPLERLRRAGLNPLSFGCLAAQVVLLLLVALSYQTHGLSMDFDGFRGILASIVLVVWVSFVLVPGPRKGRLTAEVLLAWLLTFSLVSIVVPGQYAALAFGRPFVDGTLARLDAALGIDVSRLLIWTEQHPRVLSLLMWAYDTLKWQLLLAIPAFWLLRDRRALWEYVFHFHVCLSLTLVASAVWPVAGVYQWFDFTTPMNLSRVIVQVNGFNDGSLTNVRWSEMEGLISMPSFHTATGVFVSWTLRRHWWLATPMVAINFLLILATVLTGLHYAVDVLAGTLMCVGSFLVYPAIERRLAIVPSIAAGTDAPSPPWRPIVVRRDPVS